MDSIEPVAKYNTSEIDKAKKLYGLNLKGVGHSGNKRTTKTKTNKVFKMAKPK